MQAAHTRLMHDLRRVAIVAVLVITYKNRCFEIVGGNYSQSVGRVRGLTSFRARGQKKREGQGFLYNCAQRSVDKTRCFEVIGGNYSQSDQTGNYFSYNTIYTLMFSAMQSDYEAK